MKSEGFFQQKLLVFTILLAMTLVATELTGVIIWFCCTLILLKWLIEYKNWGRPKKFFTNILVIFLLIGVLFQFRTLATQESAYTFLLGLSALKILDYADERDKKLLILIGFILVSAKALFSLDFYWFLPSVLAIVGLWYNLLPPNFSNKSKFFGRLLLISMPITIVLFILFPRIILPWAMGRGQPEIGRTGFSNSLRPGDVAEIINDGTLVFRAKTVSMKSEIQMNTYWKGAVLDFSEGLSWHQGKKEFQKPQPLSEVKEPSFEAVLESEQSNYLFVLEGTRYVESDGNKVLQFPYQTFRLVGFNKSSAVYRGYVQDLFRDETVPTKVHLQTPELKGRVIDFVKDVNARNLNTSEKLLILKNLFMQNDFRYTLKPGSYRDGDLEEFLFLRRKGFCEHFAGAYATMARALGVPSRVVVGYHGGQFNPWGKFWKITNRDAHAWVEIYHEGFWQRVDPTAWVAPLRLEIGAEEFFSLSESDQWALAKLKAWDRMRIADQGFAKELLYWVEDLNYRWTYFLIDFQPSEAQGNWRLFSLSRWWFVFFVLLVGVLVSSIIRSSKNGLGYNILLLKEVERWGRKKGVTRSPFEPPLSYFLKLGKKFPESQNELIQIYQYFDQCTYAEENPQLEGKNLLKLWKSRIRKIR